MRMKQHKKLLHVDIYYIGLVGFNWATKQPNTTVFITSLYEIDQMIEDREIKSI